MIKRIFGKIVLDIFKKVETDDPNQEAYETLSDYHDDIVTVDFKDLDGNIIATVNVDNFSVDWENIEN